MRVKSWWLWYDFSMKKTIELPTSMEEKDALILAQQAEIPARQAHSLGPQWQGHAGLQVQDHQNELEYRRDQFRRQDSCHWMGRCPQPCRHPASPWRQQSGCSTSGPSDSRIEQWWPGREWWNPFNLPVGHRSGRHDPQINRRIRITKTRAFPDGRFDRWEMLFSLIQAPSSSGEQS